MMLSRQKTSGLCYFTRMRSISLHSVRDRAVLGMLVMLMLALGSFRAWAQEEKPVPPPTPADAKDKDKKGASA